MGWMGGWVEVCEGRGEGRREGRREGRKEEKEIVVGAKVVGTRLLRAAAAVRD